MHRKKFIHLTPITTLGLPFYEMTVCAGRKKYDRELKERCIKAFRRFDSVWNFNDFWKRGNTFDACLVFADALQQKWPDDAAIIYIQERVEQMLQENYTYFKSFDPNGFWADDFGWWGLMALNARKHLLKLGNRKLADKYIELSSQLCWEQGKKHAYDVAGTAQPVPHGYSNGDANRQHKGVKNTATNALFFLLSSRLYRTSLTEAIPGNEAFLEMAYQQWISGSATGSN